MPDFVRLQLPGFSCKIFLEQKFLILIEKKVLILKRLLFDWQS